MNRWEIYGMLKGGSLLRDTKDIEEAVMRTDEKELKEGVIEYLLALKRGKYSDIKGCNIR